MNDYTNWPIDSAVIERAIARAHVLRDQAVDEFFTGLRQRLARAFSVDLSHRGTPKAAH